ncbi:sterile alpha motif domain-containing protein 15-like isoform X8 [Leguminivora glycinivorella]|uniref:sterile alpha motif domain-containing protein 15-like isoform X8 n=1 Tax=Leguminivora glycinivorella TaxID=1035111 RepID=UPI00200ED531|nr:sterile alpha motif domain-containing protein 15-like isoform X8 [Leguminivora glycinivorella]
MDVMLACRCCLLCPPDKDLTTPHTHLGKTEIYADMIKECFDIQLQLAMGGSGSSGICCTCVGRLRDASDFKLQVQRSQAELQARSQGASLVKEEESAVECENPEMQDTHETCGSEPGEEPAVKPEMLDEDTPEEILHEEFTVKSEASAEDDEMSQEESAVEYEHPEMQDTDESCGSEPGEEPAVKPEMLDEDTPEEILHEEFTVKSEASAEDDEMSQEESAVEYEHPEMQDTDESCGSEPGEEPAVKPEMLDEDTPEEILHEEFTVKSEASAEDDEMSQEESAVEYEHPEMQDTDESCGSEPGEEPAVKPEMLDEDTPEEILHEEFTVKSEASAEDDEMSQEESAVEYEHPEMQDTDESCGSEPGEEPAVKPEMLDEDTPEEILHEEFTVKSEPAAEDDEMSQEESAVEYEHPEMQDTDESCGSEPGEEPAVKPEMLDEDTPEQILHEEFSAKPEPAAEDDEMSREYQPEWETRTVRCRYSVFGRQRPRQGAALDGLLRGARAPPRRRDCSQRGQTNRLRTLWRTF